MEKPFPGDTEILNSVIEESPIPIGLYIGREMKIKVANKAMLDLLGKRQDAVGKSMLEVFNNATPPTFEKILSDVYRTGESTRATQWAGIQVNGESGFEFIFKPLKDQQGQTWGILHTAINSTSDVKTVQHSLNKTNLIRERETLFSFVEHSVDFMGITDANMNLIYLNKNGKKLIGLDPEVDVSKIQVKDLYAPEHADIVREKIDPALTKNGKWSGTIYLRNLKTGEKNPFYADFIQIPDPVTGEQVWGVTIKDLRAEIAASEALVLSEKRFRNLVQHAPVAIGIVRGSNLVVEVANAEILRLVGKDKSVIGLPVLQAIPEIINQVFPELLLQVFETGEPAYGHETPGYFVRNGKEEYGYFNFIFAPAREIDGTISGVIVVGNEVTSQVEQKKRLEESERRFRNLVLEAPMAQAVYMGRDLVIDLANEIMIRYWGKDETVIGKRLRDAVPELEGQPFLDILDEVYTTGIPYHTEQQSADLLVDGKLQTFWFNFTYKPLRTSEGDVYAIIHSAVDISSQVHLQKQKDDFLGVASHELKTPVTSIKAYAQVLETMLRDSGDMEKANMVGKLDVQVNRLTKLIGDLLDVTKINSGRIKFHRTYFDFNDLVREMTEDIQRISRDHSIVEALEPVGEIYGDRDRIGQVIVNLMTNAIKYSPDADKIMIYTRLKDNSVELSVEDFGIGISKAKQSRVFEQFYRVGGKKQLTYPGLGLGLYISSEIIKREGGKIWVDSIEGKGSKFGFSLPASKQKGG